VGDCPDGVHLRLSWQQDALVTFVGICLFLPALMTVFNSLLAPDGDGSWPPGRGRAPILPVESFFIHYITQNMPI
jgi:hypothetical protein